MDYSIIIPCYNCENTVGDLITKCLEYTPNVFVVNDGSEDNSWEVIKKSKAIIINHKRNYGVGHAIKTGINKALKYGCGDFITIDADGAHNPANIPNLLDCHFSNNNDMTIGDRWINVINTMIYPSTKILSNKFASSLVNYILGTNFNDVSCGFRVLNAVAYNKIKISQSEGYDFLYHSIFILQNKGKIGSCAIDCIYNAEDLFMTRTSELLSLLDVSITHTQIHSILFNTLIKIKNKVSKNEKIYIRIDKMKIIAYPLSQYNGYMFQFQNSNFVDFNADISL